MGSLHLSVATLEQLLLASNVISKVPFRYSPRKGTHCSSCCPATGYAMGKAAHGQGAAAPHLGSAMGSCAGCVSKATGRLPALRCTQKVSTQKEGTL